MTVVGGFVQQQQFRRRHQRACQGQAHAPAAGKALYRLHPLVRLEAQAGQQLFGARGRAPGAGFHQCRLDFCNLRALVVRQRSAARLQFAQVRVAVDDEFTGGAVVGIQFLLDAGDAPADGQVHGAGVQVQGAGQQGEQRGLACAVLAHDADAFARMNNEFSAVQQHFRAAAQGQSSSAYHRPHGG
ncbi:hypothetical protein G6F22_018069 [Rhizopus arrhizus]|nr:hypothetical protein G6F22_018069 [Rhizopus arrhizus]